VIDLALTGGRVLDPARGFDAIGDVLIDHGRIVGITPPGGAPAARDVIDARGLWVTPGLIDMHVHLREPGGAHKETIATGLAAAAAGGFTAVAAMANTSPVNDTPEITRWMLARAAEVDAARLLPIAAVTVGLGGEELTDFRALRRAGAVAFSDDGVPIRSAEVMRHALVAARAVDAPIIAHEEDPELAGGGVVDAGEIAERLGVPGMPGAAEERMIARDCVLAAETGGALHVAHISTAAGIARLREARARDVAVTAEATPHHFTLARDAVLRHGTHAKMNPPLRSAADVAAIRQALADGTIDAIASDHAPHHADEKARDLRGAPFGIVGVETALGLTLACVHAGVLSAATAILALSCAPARILGVPGGRLTAGATADVTLIDPDVRWTVDARSFRSLGRNTPFDGTELRGRALAVCVGGRLHGDLTERRRG